ncbi:MAG: hypothetical protein JO166_00840 [Deltaproteobacteria bacterium]|nr:hypothetical protein [Deltaproteobacteria bacterium]
MLPAACAARIATRSIASSRSISRQKLFQRALPCQRPGAGYAQCKSEWRFFISAASSFFFL